MPIAKCSNQLGKIEMQNLRTNNVLSNKCATLSRMLILVLPSRVKPSYANRKLLKLANKKEMQNFRTIKRPSIHCTPSSQSISLAVGVLFGAVAIAVIRCSPSSLVEATGTSL